MPRLPFHSSCVLCGTRAHLLCRNCQRLALWGQTPAGLPVSCLGPYGGALAALIQRLKYREETFLARRLGAALGQLHLTHRDHIETLGSSPRPPSAENESRRAVYVPVPLHPERLAQRGYNQSALLARAAAHRTGSQVDYAGLSRVENTRAQAHLSRAERQDNTRFAFAARCRSSGSEAAPRLLVDDVFTTGSTLDAAARALREQNIWVVGGLCLAHKL